MSFTIKDIARLGNVSTTTVSRVINNKIEGISDDTRKKILEIIKENNYQPSSIARGLVTKRTKTIGLIIPDISNPFFPDIARGVEDEAKKLGYNVFLCNSDNDADKEEEYIRALKDKSVDGIVFTGASIQKYEYLVDLVNSSIPVVIMDRYIDSKNAFGVFLDNYKGGYIATKHLIELGHRRIGCITGPLSIKSAKDRLEGYIDALKENNILIDKNLILEGDYNITNGEESCEKLLKEDGVTAIFACNDLIAYGIYKTLYINNRRIPEDVSVVGFDNIVFSQMLHPNLTTINQPTYDMGKTAVDMLIKVIEGKKIRKRIINFIPDLVVRESTKSIVDNKE